MNSRLASLRTVRAILLVAGALSMRYSVHAAGGGAVTGTAATSRGTSAVNFGFDTGEVAVAAPDAEFSLVPLPVWASPLSLGHNGVVLLLDWNTGSYLRWRNGSVDQTSRGAVEYMNKNGEILRANPDGSYALEQGDGTLVPITVEDGGYGPTSISVYQFSSHFGIGYSYEHGLTKWNFAGGYQAIGGYGNDPTVWIYPQCVNERGDFMAQLTIFPDMFTGTFVNDHFFSGKSGSDINNSGSALLRDWDDYLGSVGLPLFWDGSLHTIGDSAGTAISLNDHDEIIGRLDDGRFMLWRRTNGPTGAPVFTPTDLGEATGLNIDHVVQINNAGAILLATWNEAGEYQPFLLVPKTEGDRLGVDFDRNGIIDTSPGSTNPDRELFRKHLPWYFWVNDDDDAGETDGTDIPGRGHNGEDGVVNGVRDLVDFFPVHLDIAGLLHDYPADNPAVTYKLAQADGAANFLITDLTPAIAGDYQRDAVVASALGNAPVINITADGVALNPAFLAKILSEGKGVLLLEACKATTAPLRLEVWRSGVREAGIELPLSFAGVESMFRHKNLVSAVDMHPETADRDGAPNWPDELNNHQAFVFVHGYNVNQEQARGWQAEFFKRLWWSGSRAQFWGVTWYGTESQITVRNSHLTANYQANVIHAFGTAPLLADFVRKLRADQPSLTKVNAAGHSLGNMVVSSAISDYSLSGETLVDRYFMIDAAVAAEAYDGAQNSQVVQPDDGTATMPHTEWNKDFGDVYPARLWATNWFRLFQTLPDDGRAKLTWRDRFAPRTGTVYYDFHSTGEEVLDFNGESTPSLSFVLLQTAANKLGEYLHFEVPFIGNGQPAGHKSWQYQEQLKGRTITGKVLGSNFGGWGFNNHYFKKQSGGYGKGPVMISAVLSPTAAAAASAQLTDADLQVAPFFRAGSPKTKVGTWTHDASGKPDLLAEPLALLYRSETGSAFASAHRDTLLARMIPSMSPAAGRIAVPVLGNPSSDFNFDMNGTIIRPDRDTEGNPRWPGTRGQDFRWWHSDLREIAYPYVRGLYKQITIAGSLGEEAP